MAIESRDLRDACNLSDEELKARLELLSGEFFALDRKREELPSGLALTFDDTSKMRARLDEFVATERICCSSIDWLVQSVSRRAATRDRGDRSEIQNAAVRGTQHGRCCGGEVGLRQAQFMASMVSFDRGGPRLLSPTARRGGVRRRNAAAAARQRMGDRGRCARVGRFCVALGRTSWSGSRESGLYVLL